MIAPYVMLGFLVVLIAFLLSYDYNWRAFRYAAGIDNHHASDTISIGFDNYQQGGIINESTSNLNTNFNQSAIFLGYKNGSVGYDIPLYLKDREKSCEKSYNCIVTNTTGWKDQNSLQISTINNTKNQWSSIIGQEVHVDVDDRYEFLSHMKLNEWASHSNTLLQGFNKTSKNWQEILKCPYDIKGPVQWTEFRCSVTIDQNITKIRPVFNAGWSSSKDKEANTWFDYVNLTKFNPFIADSDLKFEIVSEGLQFPTSMAFLGSNDFLVLERDGTVQRTVDGVKSIKPLVDLDVANYEDGGLLGIAVKHINKTNKSDSYGNHAYVYLYFTAQEEQNGKAQKDSSVVNTVYRYEFVNNSLKNAKLLLNVPAGYHHDGGPILISPDNQTVYLSVGDAENQDYRVVPNKALNNKTGAEPDGRGGILRFDHDGQPIKGGILGNKYPLNLYFAYGIRNSFGMAFDPLTGKLWATDNSHETGDEINLLEPGFNGGWNKVQGIWPYAGDFIPNDSNATHNPPDLETFAGKGKYYSPEFIWNRTVGPTALIFMTTDKLGKQYENDMFVADVENGRIYHFELNQNRTGLLLDGPLRDKIADTDNELQNLVFAGNFGLITDMDVGPDGYLYFVVFNEGKVYRIVPIDQN